MKQYRIKSTLSSEFSNFWKLYESSFPEFEKRNLAAQEKLFVNSSYYLEVFYAEDIFIGFLSYWKFERYIYIEHFAINELLRGNGYGKRVLSKLIQQTDKLTILEIDPIIDKLSQNRLHFYEALGFIKNDYDYSVQSYQNKNEWYDLIIMSYDRRISQKELDTFKSNFQNIIL